METLTHMHTHMEKHRGPILQECRHFFLNLIIVVTVFCGLLYDTQMLVKGKKAKGDTLPRFKGYEGARILSIIGLKRVTYHLLFLRWGSLAAEELVHSSRMSVSVSRLGDRMIRRSCFWNLILAALMLFLLVFVASAIAALRYKEKFSKELRHDGGQSKRPAVSTDSILSLTRNKCKNQSRPRGSEALPEGFVAKSSDLNMWPLWGTSERRLRLDHINTARKRRVNLLAMAAGIKQKDLVNKMIQKFLSHSFVVMLFHYDGNVDKWKDFEWGNRVIHVSAINQTKWWFAKRFLHPDIVAEYEYIFVWDEDLGVENFSPRRYISIVRKEGLEISQPALDPTKSEVHHEITARGSRIMHRRIYKPGSREQRCDRRSKTPPCTGWIEVMAPVFSRAAWRCVWYMIQNDLIHGWGLDMQLGYCAQGDRTKKIGVVDAEYIVHYGLPTLGSLSNDGTNSSAPAPAPTQAPAPRDENMTSPKETVPFEPNPYDHRFDVRKQSYIELDVFRNRWKKAVKDDKCWIDPYPTKVKNKH